jgi:hypothetical protein
MGWERIFPMKIFNNFKTWKSFVISFVEHCGISSQTCEKPPQYHTLLNGDRSIYSMPFDGASLKMPRGLASCPILELLRCKYELKYVALLWAFSTPQIILSLGCLGNYLVHVTD